MTQCETCSAEFIGQRKTARFCSRKCAAAAKKRDRVCVRCGKHFWPRPDSRGVKAQKYCSVECRGEARRKQRICGWCGKTFTRAGHGQPKYCSAECFTQGRRKGRNVKTYICFRCGTQFERYESTVRNPEHVFCSGSCRSSARVYVRGAHNPLWKGGTFLSESTGYLYEIDHMDKKVNGEFRYKAQHIRIMEEHLGRPLLPDEHVHHLNGVKTDNRVENLLLLTAAQHRALHGFYAQQFQLEHDAKGDLRKLSEQFLRSFEPLRT